MLKVAGVDLFCGGNASAGPADEEVIALDTRRGRYRRLLLRDDRLVGTILLGDLRDARALREHLAGRQRLPEALLIPMPAGMTADAGVSEEPNATVCTCMAITQREITTAIDSYGLRTPRQVGEHTRAGSGCGTCRGEIQALLDARRPAEHIEQAAQTAA